MGEAKYRAKDDSVEVQHGASASEQTPPFVWVLSFFAAIGGFLFGYDTGVISGAMLLLRNKFHLSSIWEEIIVSVTILCACLFALIGGFLNDLLGRKIVTLSASVIFTAGAIVLGVAQNVTMLVIGRGILGMGIGFASMTVPVYIAECAPVHLRGRLVTLNNLFITGGQFFASVLDGAFSYEKQNGWSDGITLEEAIALTTFQREDYVRPITIGDTGAAQTFSVIAWYMLGLAGVPAVIQFIGFLFLPESPRWLLKKGRTDEATKVLQRIRGTSAVEEEIKAVEASLKEDQLRMEEQGDENILLKIVRTPTVRRAVIVGCSLQLIQQLSGINTVMYYSATIIKMTGVRDESTAIWMAAATASANFVFTFVGLWLVEKIGRKPLILGSLIGVFFSLVVLAIGFQLAAVNSPPITLWENVANQSSCYSYNWCEGCIENKECGFCYTEVGSSAVNGSCLPTTKDESSFSTVGRCNSTTLPADRIWAHGYCPTDYSLMGFLGLVLYLMFFAPGMGPMPWTINSEIYPLWARSTCNALSTATNWIFNFVVSMTFLTLTETITKHGTYWLLSGIVFCGIVFIFITLPETKGKQLEEVQSLFEDSLFIGCKSSKKSVDLTSDDGQFQNSDYRKQNIL